MGQPCQPLCYHFCIIQSSFWTTWAVVLPLTNVSYSVNKALRVTGGSWCKKWLMSTLENGLKLISNRHSVEELARDMFTVKVESNSVTISGLFWPTLNYDSCRTNPSHRRADTLASHQQKVGCNQNNEIAIELKKIIPMLISTESLPDRRSKFFKRLKKRSASIQVSRRSKKHSIRCF